MSAAQDACQQCARVLDGYPHAGLHAGHIWTEVRCPAYRTLDGDDCTCNRTTWHCLCGARVALRVDRIVPDHLDNHGRWCAFSRCTIAPRFLAASGGAR
jgi:hypothetical protein